MQQTVHDIEDGVLTLRVVGEFSAGKTRVIREILQDKIPENLLPISSQEAQTKLQLEISYGEQDQLLLIKKSDDRDQALILQILQAFPSREAVSQYDPYTHRLRLLINEPLFILTKGDGYHEDNTPKKLFLIDTPGWNSGEDDLAEQDARQFFVGEHNLAIIYVCHANRLDGELNQQHLNNFLDALDEAMFVSKQAHLQVIVTHCPAADQERLTKRMEQRVYDAWQELYFDRENLSVHVHALDFAEMSTQQIKQFKDKLWSELLKPMDTEKFELNRSYSQQILTWQQNWDIRQLLSQQLKIIAQMEALIANIYINGQFIENMNMTRLKGLSQSEIQQRLTERWYQQLKISSAQDLALAGLYVELPASHPLTMWWNQYWLTQIKKRYAPLADFIKTMQQTIEEIDHHVQNLQAYLSYKLNPSYLLLSDHIQHTSFELLMSTVTDHMQHLPLDQLIATLLKLSILQSRYQDHISNLKEESYEFN